MEHFIPAILILAFFVYIETDLWFLRKSLNKIQDKEEKIEYKENEELKDALRTFLKDYWFLSGDTYACKLHYQVGVNQNG